jgi:putative phosphoesterase
MSKKNTKNGPTKQLKGEWFKIGEDFYQQTWEQKFGGKNRHFQGGAPPTKLYLKNDKRISADAFKEARAIWQGMQAAPKQVAAEPADQGQPGATGQPANQASSANGQPQAPGQVQVAAPAGVRMEQGPDGQAHVSVNINKPNGEPLTDQDKQMAQQLANQAVNQANANDLIVGVISDTHGTLPDVVINAMRENHVQHILHAGDIGSAQVIQTLSQIAPITAVTGNMDSSNYGFPFTAVGRLVLGHMRILLMHRPEDIEAELRKMQAAAAAGQKVQLPNICIMGHTHIPKVESQNGILMVNPGSASRPLGGSKPGFMVMELKDGQHANIRRVEW